MDAHILNKELQDKISPEQALHLLKEGNKRFVNNLKLNRNVLEQVNLTSEGQYPMAIVLSCIDSRTSAELIFDQGLGDVFSVRIAGNVVNKDILGSMEYACKVAGSKYILVLGHTKCGAIKGACDGISMGNLTHLIDKISPAIEAETSTVTNRNASNAAFVNNVATRNVHYSVEQIMAKSPILAEMLQNGEVGIGGAMYDVETGRVSFM